MKYFPNYFAVLAPASRSESVTTDWIDVPPTCRSYSVRLSYCNEDAATLMLGVRMDDVPERWTPLLLHEGEITVNNSDKSPWQIAIKATPATSPTYFGVEIAFLDTDPMPSPPRLRLLIHRLFRRILTIKRP